MSSDHVTTHAQRFALGVEYCGRAYHGWQRQADPALPTVQGALERALSAVADAEVQTVCAGRTDTGVHASAQCVHFETVVARSERAWLRGANSHLPGDIRVHWVQTVDANFHARFSATARRYQYLINNASVPSALYSGMQTWVHAALDAERMHAAAQRLLGEQDFSAFRGAGCQSNTPMRRVQAISLRRQDDLLVLDITANAFLLHMVRNIAGSLIEIGKGKETEAWLADVLAARDRKLAAATARPDGLYLVAVDYPDAGIPGQLLARPICN